jgi:hypothetical protein
LVVTQKQYIFVVTKPSNMTYQDTISKPYSDAAMEAIQKRVDKARQFGPSVVKNLLDSLPYDVNTAYSNYLFKKL